MSSVIKNQQFINTIGNLNVKKGALSLEERCQCVSFRPLAVLPLYFLSMWIPEVDPAPLAFLFFLSLERRSVARVSWSGAPARCAVLWAGGRGAQGLAMRRRGREVTVTNGSMPEGGIDSLETDRDKNQRWRETARGWRGGGILG